MANDMHGYDGRMEAVVSNDLSDFMPSSATSARPRLVAQPESVALPRPSTLFRYRIIKRGFDLTCVLLAAPFLLPVLLVLSILVKMSSPGPIFYGSRRVGYGASFFSMWKFRTMWVDSAEALDRYLANHPEARAEWARSAKLKEDPRVTEIGKFLRRYSLDELPQVWHVVTGQMSLVGPRPLPPVEVERYADKFDDFCCVTPGLTGLWQVSGRSNLSYPERVALDCKYIEQWSLRRDVVILLKTVKPVFNRDGAY